MKSRHGAAAILLILYAFIFIAPGQNSLPPLDRDESRFAQATKQMFESGDFVDIRFQDEARNKKPVGIYWMQAASVAAIGSGTQSDIWVYRVPSAIGAVLAVLFTYLAGTVLVGRRAAAIGAIIFALSVLMISEGHIAKTDAAMCASIAAMQVGLARVFMRTRLDPTARTPWADTLYIYVGLGISALIKGPVGLIVGLLTVAGLWLLGAGFAWVRKTRPWIGLLIVLAIFLPWAIAITIQTGWSFWHDAIFGDMLSKAVESKEQHGGIPGYYLMLAMLTLFPGSIVLIPSWWRTVQKRAEPWAMFLIAWVVPTWLVFEAFPTKLPHYVLPMYPALGLAIGSYLAAMLAGEPETTPRACRIVNISLWSIVAAVIAAFFVVAPLVYAGGLGSPDLLLSVVVLIAAGALGFVVATRNWRYVIPTAIALAAIVYLGLVERTLTVVQDLNMSRRIAETLHALGYQPATPLVASGYTEPSLVFLTSTAIDLNDDGDRAASFLKDHPDGFALVEERKLQGFLDGLSQRNLRADEVGALNGFNYSKGQKVKVAVFHLKAAS